MDTYYQLSEDKKKELFLQTEPYLTISDFEKVQENLIQMNEKYQNLEEKFENLKSYLIKNGINPF